MGVEHLPRLDTIVDPVLVTDLPTMLWTPHGHQDVAEGLMEIVDVILLDSEDEEDADAAFARASALLRSVYVVDLAWLRTTPWRERLAASFDPSDRRAVLNGLSEVRSATARARGPAPGCSSAGCARACTGTGTAPVVELDPVEQEAPGLAGVTVSWGGGLLAVARPRPRRPVRVPADGRTARSTCGRCSAPRAARGDPRRGRAAGAATRPDLRPGALRRSGDLPVSLRARDRRRPGAGCLGDVAERDARRR